ncbi:DUF6114 domain-containing protein [Streptomyces sp. NPDC092296]|uniref:DUF6114 domain-containing protein n=1 Tax=Streptomyces sp. NPDC092296 TaxID=3366012 RepID=UPI0037FED34A
MTSATADVRPDDAGTFTRVRLGFRDWRHRRPFWGGLLAVIAGLPILYFPYAHLSFGGLSLAMSTTGGAGSLIIGILVMVLGISAWFQPASRVFAGVATILLALVSIPVSNLGGFGMGLLPGLVGGGLMVAWAPLGETDALPAAPVPSGPATAEPPALPDGIAGTAAESGEPGGVEEGR